RAAIRVATLNMNGFGSLLREHEDNKWGNMYRMMCEQQIALLLLQETHLTADRVHALEKMFAHKIKIYYSEHPERPTQKEGVAIVVNRRMLKTADVTDTVIVAGRALQLSVPWHGRCPLNVLCVYAPTSDGESARREFFEETQRFYEQNPRTARPNVMAGDFNNIEDGIDRIPAKLASDRSVEAMDSLKISMGLMAVDGWRATYPDSKAYTFQRGSGSSATLSRLDRIYVDQQTFQSAREWKIHEGGVRSDHSMVSVQLSRPDAPVMGRGRPVFPTSMIKDRKLAGQMKKAGLEAVSEIVRMSQSGVRTEESNPQMVLTRLKTRWMKLARDREKETVPRLLAEILLRESAVKRVQRDTSMTDETRAAETAALTCQIRTMRETRIKQLKAKARARHRVDGERPSKYWSRMHKEVKPRDNIAALERNDEREPNGDPVYEYDSRRMCDIARKHHIELQKDGPEIKGPLEREADIDAALSAVAKTLTDEQAQMLGMNVTREEVEIALRHSKNGTAPGLDGLTYEVWKTLHARYVEDSHDEERDTFDALGLLMIAFRDIERFGVCERAGFTEGWMCPLYKGKGELAKIVNYRPITLLNTDYKILTKVFAIRL
ncbi:Endonuclease/exonuclease/phosphatase, partial [Daedaleopsis nitida]